MFSFADRRHHQSAQPFSNAMAAICAMIGVLTPPCSSHRYAVLGSREGLIFSEKAAESLCGRSLVHGDWAV
jgi:hypothetical protein